MPNTTPTRTVCCLIERFGLFPMQHRMLPSLVSEVTAESVVGSWWGHPAAHTIFRTLNEVLEDEDVMLAPLLDGKRTFVHRRLFDALCTVGAARESWQLAQLQGEAKALLRSVDDAGQVLASGPAAKRLEQALLVAAIDVHTDSGAHHKQLMSWIAFARARGLVSQTSTTLVAAKERFDAAAALLCESTGARVRFPWQVAHRGARGEGVRRRRAKPSRS